MDRVSSMTPIIEECYRSITIHCGTVDRGLIEPSPKTRKLLQQSPRLYKKSKEVPLRSPINLIVLNGVYALINLYSFIPSAHLLISEHRRQKNSAVRRSVNPYASGWQIHGFAPPPHDGFAFSTYLLYNSSSQKTRIM